MRIRLAEAKDAGAVAEIFLASRAGMTYLPRLHSDEETRAHFHHVVARFETWVAEDANGRIVGFAALSEDVLEHLYVHPDAQGQGVGSALLERAQARRPGGFGFWVFQRNEGARRFYERHGCVLAYMTDGAANEEREPDARYEWRPQPRPARKAF